MKTLQEHLSESLVMEAAAKNAHLPRKGSTVYILKFGDSVAVPAKVEDIVHTKMYGGRVKSFIAEIQLSSNKYGMKSYTQTHFASLSYDDDSCQVVSTREHGDDYYIGVSKEAIQQYVNNIGNTRLPSLLQDIEQKELELAELYKQKDEAEAQANFVVTEAMAEHIYLNESLKKGVKVKMRNAIDGPRGKHFDAVVLCDEFKVPGNEMDFERFIFIKLKDKPSYLANDVQLAIYDGEDWAFDPTFWDTVGEDIKYYEKALAQAGLKAEWNDKGYCVPVSK